LIRRWYFSLNKSARIAIFTGCKPASQLVRKRDQEAFPDSPGKSNLIYLPSLAWKANQKFAT
jgi:hypothetical protein